MPLHPSTNTGLDAREDDYCALFLRSDGSVRGTVGTGSTERTRAALLDLRYAMTLDNAIESATATVATSQGGAESSALVQALADANLLRVSMQELMPIGRLGHHGEDAPDPSVSVLDALRRNISKVVLNLRGVDSTSTCDNGNNAASRAVFTPSESNSCAKLGCTNNKRQKGYRFYTND